MSRKPRARPPAPPRPASLRPASLRPASLRPASLRPASLRPTYVCLTLLCAAGGCGDTYPATEVVVQIEADRPVQLVTERVRIRIFGRADAEGFPDEPRQDLVVALRDVEGGWPLTHGLVPFQGDDTRVYRVEAVALDATDREVAHARVVSGYVPRSRIVLRVRFHSRCLYVDPCESPEQSCGPDGECTTAVRRPEELPRHDEDAGPPAECSVAEDCDDAVACTIESCVSGVCINVPADGMCVDASGGRCDPDTGCQYGSCDASTCAPDDPCETTRCEGAACIRTSTCAPGEACCGGACCRAGQTCCGTSCVAPGCNDGEFCTTDACVAGACSNVPRTVACEDPLFCTTGETCASGRCGGGTPTCTGMSTCDEGRDECTGCATAADCPATSRVPATTCTAPDACSTMGSQMVNVTTYTCVRGTCMPSSRVETEGCTATALGVGVGCRPPTYGSLGPCRCDLTRTATRTDYVCMGGACAARPGVSDTVSCTTPPPGCGDAGPPDAGTDGGFDAGMDAGFDAGHDGGPDGGFDACVPEGSFETGSCLDGRDNDCDGFVDCLDGDCACVPRDGGGDGASGDGGPSMSMCMSSCAIDTGCCAFPFCATHPSCMVPSVDGGAP